MKIEPYFSRKIRVMSIAAMVAVVFIHSTAYLTLPNPARWNVFGEILVTRSFSRWAVPFFFALSGFWFGRSAFMRGEVGYGALLRKKIVALLVPYLSWCVLGMIFALPLLVGNNLITNKGLLERTVWAVPGIWGKFDAFWGITDAGPKTNMPLWFVRSLILLFLLGPIWRFLMGTKVGRIGLFVFAVVELLFCLRPLAVVGLSPVALSWFAVGCLLARCKVENWKISNGLFVVVSIAYIVAGIAMSLMVSGYMKDSFELLGRIDTVLIPVLGALFYWGLYERISWLQKCNIPWCVTQTFFVYCIQEIVCSYYISTGRFLLGKTDIVTFCLTLVVPWLACATCMVLAILLHRLSPRFYSVITGGRA